MTLTKHYMSEYTLAELEATSVPMKLVHPTKGELDVSLEVTGPDSPEFRALRTSFIKRRIAKGDSAVNDFDEITQQTDELLAVSVVGWSDDKFFGGPFSRKAIMDILKNPKLAWIRDQLNAFTDERTNFFR